MWAVVGIMGRKRKEEEDEEWRWWKLHSLAQIMEGGGGGKLPIYAEITDHTGV